MEPGTCVSLDVNVPGDIPLVFWYVGGVVKKSRLKGWKTPKLSCPNLSRWSVFQTEQLDMFGYGDYFYHEGRFLYELSSKEDESAC